MAEVIALPNDTGGVPTVSAATVWIAWKRFFSSSEAKPLFGSAALAPSYPAASFATQPEKVL